MGKKFYGEILRFCRITPLIDVRSSWGNQRKILFIFRFALRPIGDTVINQK